MSRRSDAGPLLLCACRFCVPFCVGQSFCTALVTCSDGPILVRCSIFRCSDGVFEYIVSTYGVGHAVGARGAPCAAKLVVLLRVNTLVSSFYLCRLSCSGTAGSRRSRSRSRSRQTPHRLLPVTATAGGGRGLQLQPLSSVNWHTRLPVFLNTPPVKTDTAAQCRGSRPAAALQGGWSASALACAQRVCQLRRPTPALET